MRSFRGAKLITAIMVVLVPLLASCGKLTKVSAQSANRNGAPAPTPNEKFREVFRAMDSTPKFAALRTICPSAVVPEKPVDSGYRRGKCSDDPLKCLEECKANKGGSCYALATLIEREDESPGDYPDRLYLRACELGVVSGCTNRAARVLEKYPDDRKIEKCATDTFEKTCSLEDPWGCTMFAWALTLGRGRDIDLEEALKMAGKACKYGEMDTACPQSKKLIDLIKRIQKDSDPKPAGTP